MPELYETKVCSPLENGKEELRCIWLRGGEHPIRCSSKERILEKIGGNNDTNASAAFDEMVKDNLIEFYLDKYYVINFDKRTELDSLIAEESEEELAMTQPEQIEFDDLELRFSEGSNWRYPNRRHNYYCISKKDRISWIVLVKKRAVGKPERLILGAFGNPRSRIARIWAAAKEAAHRHGGTFIQFDVEKIDLEACGTARQFSKAAFHIFKHLGLVKIVTRRRRADVYQLTGNEPDKTGLDSYI